MSDWKIIALEIGSAVGFGIGFLSITEFFFFLERRKRRKLVIASFAKYTDDYSKRMRGRGEQQ